MAIVLCLMPAWRAGFGIALALVAVGTTGATFLTVGAGEAFENSRPFNEPGVALHADLARTLRWLVVGWVLAIVVLVVIDRILPRDRSSSALRVAALAVSGVVAVMSVLSVVWVIRTGHQGAKVTWQLGGGDGGGPPGFPGGGGDGPPGQSFPGGGQGGVPAPPGSGP